jgi:hypothetical protein
MTDEASIDEQIEQPTQRARQECFDWLCQCLQFGWKKTELDALEAIWWKFHDNTGQLIKSHPTPPSAAQVKRHDVFDCQPKPEPVRQQHPMWDLLHKYGDAREQLALNADNPLTRREFVQPINVAWEALWQHIERQAGEIEALKDAAGDDAFPCAGCGMSKYQCGKAGERGFLACCPECKHRPCGHNILDLIAMNEMATASNAEQLDRIRQLEADLSSARRNERRYLWLREQAFKSQGDLVIELLDAYDNYVGGNLNEGVDRACDAAMGDGK